jgi:hypothetical protein
MDQIFIQHRFSIDRDGQHYNDALNFPIDMSMEDFCKLVKLSPDDISTMKDERFNNWIDAIKNPAPQPEVFKEDLQAQAMSIDEQIASLQAQKVQVSEAIVTAKPRPIDIKPIEEPIELVEG